MTRDQDMRYEQNLTLYDKTIVTIMSGDWNVIRRIISLIREGMATAVQGQDNPVHLQTQD